MRLRQLPPTAWVLFGGTFINRFGTFVMPMLAMYLTRAGYSIAQSGIAVSAYGAGHLATSMLGGHLADRISSGLAALFAATVPLWMALLVRFLIRGERLTTVRIAGLIAGFCGVAAVVAPDARCAAFGNSAG